MLSTRNDAVCTPNHRWYASTNSELRRYDAHLTVDVANTEVLSQGRNARGYVTSHCNRRKSFGVTAPHHRHHRILLMGSNPAALYMWPDMPFLHINNFLDNKPNCIDWSRFVGLVIGDGGITSDKRSGVTGGIETARPRSFRGTPT